MTTLPYTGREYLDSLDDGREVWIYGERVKKIVSGAGSRIATSRRQRAPRNSSKPGMRSPVLRG